MIPESKARGKFLWEKAQERPGVEEKGTMRNRKIFRRKKKGASFHRMPVWTLGRRRNGTLSQRRTPRHLGGERKSRSQAGGEGDVEAGTRLGALWTAGGRKEKRRFDPNYSQT